MKKIKYNNIDFYIIKDFDDYYISKCGKILSTKIYKKGKIRALFKSRNGYIRVRLSNGGLIKYYLVHRLLAKTFIPNPRKKPQVNHKNGIKDDNRLENLEWCTHSENQKHRFSYLGHKAIKGFNNICSKKVQQLDLQNNLIKIWGSIMDVERELKINNASISQVCQDKRKTAGGFKWEYL